MLSTNKSNRFVIISWDANISNANGLFYTDEI